MIQITLTGKKVSQNQNKETLENYKILEESSRFLELRGVKSCPILCVRLKTMAVFRPEKKEVDPQKL